MCVQSDGERVHGVPFVWKRNGPDIREDRGREEHTKTKISIRDHMLLGPGQFQCTDDFATKAEQLGKLTRRNVPFKWQTEQEKAFKRLKEDLAQTDSLAYFDPKAATRIVADASSVGIGAVLTEIQNGEKRVINHASRSLSDIERR